MGKTRTDNDRAIDFHSLFDGRVDAYGGDEGQAIWETRHLYVTERHLNGIEGIGVYPVVNNMVVWGCCDIDTGKWAEAHQLATALKGMGLVPWVERSRSKGWHVWIFTKDWVSAAEMRRCLKVAYAAIDLQAKEANPKSENLRPNQLGNYVRLPYKGGLIVDPERQCMMRGWHRYGDGSPLTFRQFIDGRNVRLEDWGGEWTWEHPGFYSDPNKIKHWASKWYERPKAIKVSEETEWAKLDVTELEARLGPVTHRVWLGGPERADRSSTLIALGHEFAKLGFKPDETMALLMSADGRWGKYHQRPDGEEYIADIVNRVYS